MAAQMQPQIAPQQQQASGGQQQPQQQQQSDLDPISKFKIHLPRLKESLNVSTAAVRHTIDLNTCRIRPTVKLVKMNAF